MWRIATRPYRGPHVAPFPVDLPLRAIAAGCPPGGVVLDPFSGAGTTGLAALQLGRQYVGIDINATFHDEALNRLAQHLPDDTSSRKGR
ncbi:site-specific DNA-methyltransferase [Plantactinospora sp. S1510]|uniref:Site-specific DNA-methyltransferase n=1 Tax=Plantactinospora alkalitolerans TaxID=2789879 RepID=A0ABS0H2N6_9ACTN|nr:site-specific DNA-methyltransferase [Plantactinospora alkalitolerans]MBF9132740.1 site-specific DNA-methyltransferase [Plantactinospora alkalitolerans]